VVKSDEYGECSKEEHRLRMFDNRVLSRIFGSKREEVTGGCREPYNDELHNLHSSPKITIKSNQENWQGM
jgi:hypothetical protein